MNLVISTVGDKSIHKEWLSKEQNFDLVLLYYGDDEKIAHSYYEDTPYVYMAKGFKWWLIKSFIQTHPQFMEKYNYIWFPDDDVRISTENINYLFDFCKEYNLWLCQPAMKGYISHEITKPQYNSVLRYTNFVEVLAPMMSYKTVYKLLPTFDANYSSWGYEVTWDKILGNPKDKIAIIDSIIMEHTKPVGNPALYSKIPHNLETDQQIIFDKFNITEFPSHKEYSRIEIKYKNYEI